MAINTYSLLVQGGRTGTPISPNEEQSMILSRFEHMHFLGHQKQLSFLPKKGCGVVVSPVAASSLLALC